MIAVSCSWYIVAGGVFYCVGEKVESMDDAIDLSDCGLGEVVLHKFNGVRKRSAFVTASATLKQR